MFLDKLFLANETEFKIDKTRLLKKKCARQKSPLACCCARARVGGANEPRGVQHGQTGPKGGQNPQRALRRAAPGAADTKHGRKSSHPGPQGERGWPGAHAGRSLAVNPAVQFCSGWRGARQKRTPSCCCALAAMAASVEAHAAVLLCSGC